MVYNNNKIDSPWLNSSIVGKPQVQHLEFIFIAHYLMSETKRKQAM